jgi:hypothetical protein
MCEPNYSRNAKDPRFISNLSLVFIVVPAVQNKDLMRTNESSCESACKSNLPTCFLFHVPDRFAHRRFAPQQFPSPKSRGLYSVRIFFMPGQILLLAIFIMMFRIIFVPRVSKMHLLSIHLRHVFLVFPRRFSHRYFAWSCVHLLSCFLWAGNM